MPKPFKGTIKLDVRDSRSRLGRRSFRPRAPDGAPNVLDRPLRRHGPRGVGAVRRADRDADAEAARRQRPHVLASGTRRRSARRRARASSPAATTTRTGWRASPRASIGYPGGNAHIPKECGDARRGDAPGRLEHVLARQEPQRPGRRPARRARRRRAGRCTRASTASTASSAARRTSGIRRPHRRQPPHRPAVPAGGGLPPLEGPGRPGDPDDPRREGQRAVKAVVHVVLPGREPRAAPRRRRSAPTSTRASSTTATRPTASGRCRA